ncbi:MAG: hypothetical protein M4579_003251, partial [Chaenotheca gracillima]
MVGVVETPGVAMPPPGATMDLGFSVSHQKVELDIDFRTKTLKGKAELTISPHHKDLKSIRLNCRQCVLKRVRVNGKGPSLKYQEPYSRFKIHPDATVHQYHQLRNKLGPALKEPPEEELVVTLPKSVHIEELDPFSAEAQAQTGTRGGGAGRESTADVPVTAGPRSADDHTGTGGTGPRFTPLTLYVEYAIENVRDGIHFVGCDEDDPRYPHAYTRNSMFPGSSCCLFPCVDDVSARCTWEISIKCAKTLGDAFRPAKFEGLASATAGDAASTANGTQGNTEDGDMSEDAALEMTVVCSGDLTDE